MEKDISKVEVQGLDKASYVDKVDGAKTKTQSATIKIAGEVDRVYSPKTDPSEPVTVLEGGKQSFRVVRDNLTDVVVWNPWTEKAGGMSDFAPKDGFKQMICIEAGSVGTWQSLEPGDAFEGAQTIYAA
jgi:glucose-6-phosphate 1-epimerase